MIIVKIIKNLLLNIVNIAIGIYAIHAMMIILSMKQYFLEI